MDLHHLLLAGLPAHSGPPRLADILGVRRHVRKVPSPDEQITANHRSWAPTGLPLDNLVSYLGVDGMAEEWWSTISQRSPFLT
jgi:hypothetical protein